MDLSMKYSNLLRKCLILGIMEGTVIHATREERQNCLCNLCDSFCVDFKSSFLQGWSNLG